MDSSFETGADDSSADPPPEIRPLVLFLAGDVDARHDADDEGADGDADSTSSSTGSTSSSQQREHSSSAKLEEEMGRAVDALQRSEEARVELSSGLGIEAGESLCVCVFYLLYLVLVAPAILPLLKCCGLTRSLCISICLPRAYWCTDCS